MSADEAGCRSRELSLALFCLLTHHHLQHMAIADYRLNLSQYATAGISAPVNLLPYAGDYKRSVEAQRSANAYHKRQLGVVDRVRLGVVELAAAAMGRVFKIGTNEILDLFSAFLPGTVRQLSRRTVPEVLAAYAQMPALRMNIDVVAAQFAAIEWEAFVPTAKGRKGWDSRAVELREMAADLSLDAIRERKQMILRLIDEGDMRALPRNEPILRFLRAGIPGYLTGLQVRRLNVIYRLLTGESFGVMERNNDDIPVQQVPLPPSWVVQIPLPGMLEFIARGPNGQSVPIPITEMLWRKTPDPLNPFGRGVGEAQSVATELDTDLAAGEHLRNLFYNRARPDLLVTGQLGDNKGAVEKLRREWMQRHQGPNRGGLPAFLSTTGAIDVHDLTPSLKELDLVPMRRQLWTLMRQVIGQVPEELAGDMSNSNRATSFIAHSNWMRTKIIPMAADEAHFIQERLVQEFGNEDVVIGFVSPLEKDREFELEVAKTAPWSLRINEWRQLSGQPPIDDADGGQSFMVPIGQSPVADLGEYVPPGGQGTTNGKGSASVSAPASLLDLPLRRQGAQPLLRQGQPRIARGKLPYHVIEELADKLSPAMTAVFTHAIEAGRGKIDTKMMAQLLDAGEREMALRQVPSSKIADQLGDRADTTLRAILGHAGETATAIVNQQLGSKATFDLAHPNIGAWSSERAADLRDWISASVVESAQRVLADEYDAGLLDSAGAAAAIRDRLGLSAVQSSAIANAVKEEMASSGGSAADAYTAVDVDSMTSSYYQARAKLFGAGQSFQAAQEGQRQAWEQATDAGIIPQDAQRQWVDQEDAKTCKDCLSLHGQQRGMDEMFEVGADGDHPGLQVLNPGDPHEECRCAALIVYPS